jgi:hypothetical protein
LERLQACSHYKIFINCLSTPTVAIFNGEIATEVAVAIHLQQSSSNCLVVLILELAKSALALIQDLWLPKVGGASGYAYSTGWFMVIGSKVLFLNLQKIILSHRQICACY